jgi:hypothetical protein
MKSSCPWLISVLERGKRLMPVWLEYQRVDEDRPWFCCLVPEEKGRLAFVADRHLMMKRLIGRVQSW